MAANMKPFLQEIWKKSGFTQPTAIQSKAIPLILDGRDVVAESPTGTGKTIAYLLPALQKIDPGKKDAQTVILAPTRELVMQIQQVIQKWTEGSDIHATALIGGADLKRQLEKLKQHPQIVVGTANRILELINMKKLKMHEVKTIVFDEGDQLLVPEAMDTIQNIIKTTLQDRQVVCFSATVSAKTEQLVKEMMKHPEIIRIKADTLAPSKAEHIYFLCEPREKMDLLRRIVKMDQIKGLAFINDMNYFHTVAARLQDRGISFGALSGESKKTERESALKNFRDGKFPLLLVTDVAARGLDIEGLTHVIHVDFPKDLTQYVHRSGRTGRMGATGTIISMVTEREERVLQQYSRKLGIPIHKKSLHMGKVLDAKRNQSVSNQTKKTTPQPTSKRKG
ncbi:DEAD/DEAH box helicase [Fodinisporobacter ferrooxydans]|uniref:DEAD/DEAH box helicase n=1 Tax=Fodinisporobacter ferrooxydans TaxID=2901836 RepID=UPI003D30F64E